MKNEYLKIVRSLRKHHSLFAQFWSVGTIVETTSPKIPTAAIAFDRKTGVGMHFLINPGYWAQLKEDANHQDKSFVVCHEIMHVYLDHGRRSRKLDPVMANVAQDVVINHTLVDRFGFDRSKLSHGEKYCWIDTVFPDRNDIESNRCFEYYYEKLKEQGGLPEGGSGNQTVDVHDFMDDMTDEELDAIQEAAEDLMDRITPEEVENFEEVMQQSNAEEQEKAKGAGSMSGVLTRRISLGRVVKKRKWETVVADVLGRFKGMERDIDLELWTRPNRRLAAMLDDDLMLPASVHETIVVRDRIDVWFFQDTSASCTHLAERFFRAAASLPDDRFRVRVFCFSDAVHETTLASGKLYGVNGGTSFRPMEAKIQELIQSEPGTAYPQAVFVVTDGDAWDGVVRPEFPKRWNFFLTAPGNKKHFDPECNSYQLSEYE